MKDKIVAFTPKNSYVVAKCGWVDVGNSSVTRLPHLGAEADTGMLYSTRLVYYRVPCQQCVASLGLHHA